MSRIHLDISMAYRRAQLEATGKDPGTAHSLDAESMTPGLRQRAMPWTKYDPDSKQWRFQLCVENPSEAGIEAAMTQKDKERADKIDECTKDLQAALDNESCDYHSDYLPDYATPQMRAMMEKLQPLLEQRRKAKERRKAQGELEKVAAALKAGECISWPFLVRREDYTELYDQVRSIWDQDQDRRKEEQRQAKRIADEARAKVRNFWLGYYADQSQKDRAAANLLPEAEYVASLTEIAFEDMTWDRYCRLAASDLCHSDECSYPDPSFSSAGAAEATAEEFSFLQAVKAEAAKIVTLPIFEDAEVTVELRVHTGECDRCGEYILRKGVAVTVILGDLRLRREFAV